MWRVLITDIERCVWRLISAASHLQLYCVRWKLNFISSKPHNKRNFCLVSGQVKINILRAPDPWRYDIFRRNVGKHPMTRRHFLEGQSPLCGISDFIKKNKIFPLPKDKILKLNLFLLPTCVSLIPRKYWLLLYSYNVLDYDNCLKKEWALWQKLTLLSLFSWFCKAVGIT